MLHYAQTNNPLAAQAYFKEFGLVEQFMELAFEKEDWQGLSDYLISSKKQLLWEQVLKGPHASQVFDCTVESCSSFSVPESASALVKALVSLKETEKLLEIAASLLHNNPKFKTSRSLQTLYLLNLIPKTDSNEQVEEALDHFENYAIEDVLKVCVTSNRPRLILKILKRFKVWDLAFKVALFTLNDPQEAEAISEIWQNSEAYNGLFEYYLANEDASKALAFSTKISSVTFRSREFIVLLSCKSMHKELYDFLCRLRAHTGGLDGPLERVMFDCLVKLDRMDELQEFIGTASPKTACDLGLVLMGGKQFSLAAEAFLRGHDYDNAVKCFIYSGNLIKASEYALKSSNTDVWIKVMKLALQKRDYETSQKVAIKILQTSPQSIQVVFEAYNRFSAQTSLIETLEALISIATPSRDVLVALGSLYARHTPERLEAFMTKYHTLLPATFVNILAEYHLWKESFKFFILAADIDRALQVVMAHPIVQLEAKKVAAVLPRLKNPGLLNKLMAFYCEFDAKGFLELKPEFLSRLGAVEVATFLKEKNLLFVIEEVREELIKKSPSVIIDLYIQSNDYYGLVEAIKKAPSVDTASLAKSLLQPTNQRHFRVLGAKLLSNSGHHAEALKVLLKEEALVDSLLVLSQTGNQQYAEALLKRYARNNNAVMFVITAYVLFDLIRADVVFECIQRASFSLQTPSLALYCQMIRNRFK